MKGKTSIPSKKILKSKKVKTCSSAIGVKKKLKANRNKNLELNICEIWSHFTNKKKIYFVNQKLIQWAIMNKVN